VPPPSASNTGLPELIVPPAWFVCPALSVEPAVVVFETWADLALCWDFSPLCVVVKSLEFEVVLRNSVPDRDPVSPLLAMLLPTVEPKLLLAESSVLALYVLSRLWVPLTPNLPPTPKSALTPP